jgi:hypothetical protein
MDTRFDLDRDDSNLVSGKYALELAMDATAHHWAEILRRPVAITFAQYDHETHTGHVVQRDYFNDDDDYWLDLEVDGLHIRFSSLIDLENYLDRTYPE